MSEILGLLGLLLFAAVFLLALLTIVVIRESARPPRRTAGYAVVRGLACDPGDLDLPFEEWRLERPDGAELAVWEVSLETESESNVGMTAIFVHGWGQLRIDMLQRIDLVRDSCDRMVLYDLRGHGDASATGAGGASRLGCDEDADLLELARRCGDGPLLLVGHSMGAVVALRAAAAADSDLEARIAGVIAVAPYLDLHQSMQRRLRQSGYPARPVTDLVLLWHRLRGLRHRRLIDDFAKLACPVLIIHGNLDRVSPVEDARLLADVTSNATLHTVEAGHHDLHEVDREGQRTAVRGFVDGLLAARG